MDKDAMVRQLLEPFDPKKHTPQDVGLGGASTEYLATEYAPDGSVLNFPTIWWDESGSPKLFEGDKGVREALAQALMYEESMGRKFPRYTEPDVAVQAAKERSQSGGASLNKLIDHKPFNSPF